MAVIRGPNLDTTALQVLENLDPRARLDRESHGAGHGGERHGPRPALTDYDQSRTFKRETLPDVSLQRWPQFLRKGGWNFSPQSRITPSVSAYGAS